MDDRRSLAKCGEVAFAIADAFVRIRERFELGDAGGVVIAEEPAVDLACSLDVSCRGVMVGPRRGLVLGPSQEDALAWMAGSLSSIASA